MPSPRTTLDETTGERASPAWLRIGVFIVAYAVLSVTYQQLRASGWDACLIDALTVRPAAELLAWLRPADGVVAAGPRLAWPGGRLTLLNGCDGFEVITLFVAAVLAAELSWRRGVTTVVLGSVALWALNQLRIAALYGAFRFRQDWFDAVHTAWGPIALVAAAAAIYLAALRRPRPEPSA